MAENGLTVVGAETKQLTASEVLAGVNLIQEVKKAVMQQGTHFGVIPGCGDKPTLLKAGAEKLAMTFRLAPDLEIKDLSRPDEVRYQVICRLKHQVTEHLIGSGAGEASSNEERYKWRFAVCDAEFESTPDDRRRLKYKRDGSTIKQVRTNPSDVANTVLKMAKKRAMVDAVLTATAASDFFTQDIEDMGEQIADQNGNGHSASKAAAPRPAPKNEPGNQVTFVPTDVKEKSGTNKNGKPYTKWGIVHPDGRTFGTFDRDLGGLAIEAKASGASLTLTYEQDGKFYNAKEAFLSEVGDAQEDAELV